MPSIFRSRKFQAVMLDALVSIILHFIGRYAPQTAEDVNFLIGILQPVIIMYIGGVAYEDGQAMKAGVHPQIPTEPPQ